MGIVLFGFMIPQINNSAHIGGMVFGALCGYFLGYHERAGRRCPTAF
jgi:membrane associated rhomboid family serine protease